MPHQLLVFHLDRYSTPRQLAHPLRRQRLGKIGCCSSASPSVTTIAVNTPSALREHRALHSNEVIEGGWRAMTAPAKHRPGSQCARPTGMSEAGSKTRGWLVAGRAGDGRLQMSVLHEVFRRGWPPVSSSMPSRVQREVEQYLRCGDLRYGFVEVSCEACSWSRCCPTWRTDSGP